MTAVVSFDDAYGWLSSLKNSKGKAVKQHLLLGNGFSIAFDAARFSYTALRQQAEDQHLIGPIAQRFFATLKTQDFEVVIRSLTAAATALEVLDKVKYATDIHDLYAESDALKEALARVLAGLHPDRPYDIEDEAYLQVRRFTGRFDTLYTASYDLLLYWALMQDFDGVSDLPRRFTDDGFRDSGQDVDYVVWDYLGPQSQSIYYLHGALHLFRGDDGLRKLTWRRTEEPLIDQIRAQLADNFFPLYVAEGTSLDKLQRIHGSDYLARGLRSLAAIGGGLAVYGLSFGDNDAHILDALVRSKIERMAVSVYGNPGSDENKKLIESALALEARRKAARAWQPLEIRFFEAASVPLWRVSP